MNRIKKYTLRLCLSLAVCFLYSFFFSTQISALIINGTGSSGGGSHTVTASGGYAVSLTDAGNAPAYRFTVIDNTGYFKTQSYDIYRSAYSQYMGTGYHKADVKSPKTVLKNIYTGGLNTSATNANCYIDTDIGLTLPTSTTAVKDWCENIDNTGTLLNRLFYLNISDLDTYGWAILVEPIYPVKLQNQYHSLTVTEMSVYGALMFGAYTVPPSSGNSGSWAFISQYTNRYYPSALYTIQHYANLPAGGVLSARASFDTIINNGYGALIVYGDNLNKVNYKINYYTETGTYISTQTVAKGDSFIPWGWGDREGYTFTGWNTDINGWGTSFSTTNSYTYTWNYDLNLYAQYEPIIHTNFISHWAWGFQYSEGNNHTAKNAFYLGDTNFTAYPSSTYIMDKDRAITIPNGFYLSDTFGNGVGSASGVWDYYFMGSTMTQTNGQMGYEYGYHPYNYNISYDLNGGTNHKDNPNSYNVLYGVSLKEPTKNGYKFAGWQGVINRGDIELIASTNQFNYGMIMQCIKPNTTYNILFLSFK